MKVIITKSIIFALVAFCLISCNEKAGKIATTPTELNVYIDESIYDLMKTPLMMYDSVFTGSTIKISKGSASEVMAQLLSGKCDAIVGSRGYTVKEDSLMKAYKVPVHTKEIIAKDALVFYVDRDFPLDTINEEQLKAILTKKDTKFSDFFKKIKIEPNLICNNSLSSEFYNLKEMVLKNKKLEKYIQFYNNHDSVMMHIKNHKNDIGIGYLSHIVNNGDFKALAISFTDGSGNYIPRKPVHQAYIIQGMYPYIVNHTVLVADSKDFDFQGAFLRFISKNGNVQKYLNEFGVVPAYAKVKIIDNN